LHCHKSLHETLKMFDRDGSGKVGMKDLRTCLNSFALGLSSSQLDRLLHSFFKDATQVDGTPKIETRLFLGRFAMVYRHAEDTLKEGGRTEEERSAHEALSRIGHLLAITPLETISKSSKQSKSPRGAKMSGDEKTQPSKNGENSSALALKMVRLFETLDTTRDGFVGTNEFVAGMSRIPGIFDITFSNGAKLDLPMLKKLAKFLDKSGSISVFEFLEGLSFDDCDGVGDVLAEHILSVLFRYRHILRAASRLFDKDTKGFVHEKDFLEILRALNAEMEDSSHHFSESQMQDLCDSICEDKARTVEYDKFLDAFEIVDAENPVVAVRIGSCKEHPRKPSPKKSPKKDKAKEDETRS